MGLNHVIISTKRYKLLSLYQALALCNRQIEAFEIVLHTLLKQKIKGLRAPII